MPTVDFPTRIANAPLNPTPTPYALAQRATEARQSRHRSPKQLFCAHATPAVSHPVLRRVKRDADWLAEADQHGFHIVKRWCRTGHDLSGSSTYWTATRGNWLLQTHHRSAAGAAMTAVLGTGASTSVAAVTYWRVPGWLADALAEHGEAVHLSEVGPCVWGCTEPSFDPDAHPTLAAIYADYLSGKFSENT